MSGGDSAPQSGPVGLGVAADRSALGAILDAQGRHAEALGPLRDALALIEAELGRDHYEVAVALGVLAAVAERAGDTAQAAAFYERSLEIKRRVLGADHPDVGETCRRLGVLRTRAREPR